MGSEILRSSQNDKLNDRAQHPILSASKCDCSTNSITDSPPHLKEAGRAIDYAPLYFQASDNRIAACLTS